MASATYKKQVFNIEFQFAIPAMQYWQGQLWTHKQAIFVILL